MTCAASALLLVLAALACGQHPPDRPSVEIGAKVRAAVVALPVGHGGKVLIDIIRVVNPRQFPVNLTVRLTGQNRLLLRFALYPPDQPARVALRVPEGAAAVIVRLEGSAQEGPALIELRAVAFPNRAPR